MDKIIIENLELFANHGVFPEETKLGQKFLINMELYLPTRKAGYSDDLTESVNYGEVSHFVTEFLTTHTYKLIEAAAEQTSSMALVSASALGAYSLMSCSRKLSTLAEFLAIVFSSE